MIRNHPRDYAKILLFWFVIILVIFRNIIFVDGQVGRFIDFSLPSDIDLARTSFWSQYSLWSWGSNFGQRGNFILTLIPSSLLLFLPAYFSDSIEFLSKYQLILPIVIAGVSFYLFLNALFETLASQLGVKYVHERVVYSTFSVLYGLNNFTFSEASFGSIYLLLSYATFPLVGFFYLRYELTSKPIYVASAVVSALVCGAVIQYIIFIYAFLLTLSLLFSSRRSLLVFAVFHISACLYWLLPLIVSLGEVFADEAASSSYALGLRMLDVVLMRDYFGQRYLYEKGYGADACWLYFFGVAFLFSLVIVLLIRLKNLHLRLQIFTLMSVSIILIAFLLAGAMQAPFGTIKEIVASATPLSMLYRSSQRFLPLVYFFVHLLGMISFQTLFLANASRAKGLIGILYVFVFVLTFPWWFHGDVGIKYLTEERMPSRINIYKPSKGDLEVNTLLKRCASKSMTVLVVPLSHSLRFGVKPNAQDLTQGGDTDLTSSRCNFFAADMRGRPEIKEVISDLEDNLYGSAEGLESSYSTLISLGVDYVVVRRDRRVEFGHYAGIIIPFYKVDQSKFESLYSDAEVDIYRIRAPSKYGLVNQLVLSSSNFSEQADLEVPVDNVRRGDFSMVVQGYICDAGIIYSRTAYDKFWKAEIIGQKNGQTIDLGDSINMHGFNGWVVRANGGPDLTPCFTSKGIGKNIVGIRIHYSLQQWFLVGFVIGMVIIILGIVFNLKIGRSSCKSDH